MSNKIIFITNDNKLLEYSGELFNSNYEIINFVSDEPDINSLDCKEVVSHKLDRLYIKIIKIHGPEVNVICEKVGLAIDNMKGFPNALIDRYHKTLGNNGICFFNGNSNAVMTTCLGLINKSGKYIFEENLKGKISNNKNNNMTEDWKSIFIPQLSFNNRQYFSKTYTELSNNIQTKINGKMKCMNNLKKYIITINANKKINNQRDSISDLTKDNIENIIKNEIIDQKRSLSKSRSKSKSIPKSRSKSRSIPKSIDNDLF